MAVRLRRSCWYWRPEGCLELLFGRVGGGVAGVGGLAARAGEVDALGAAVGGVLLAPQVALGYQVVDELAHRLRGHAGLGGDVGEAQPVLDGEHLQGVAVGRAQAGAGGLFDVPVDGG